MKLSFRTSHLSINSFPDIKLPAFTLITGQNGTGKTHLLQAIKNGSVLTDAVVYPSPDFENGIKYFDWSSMVPQGDGYISSESIKNERANLYQNFNSTRLLPHIMEPMRIFARARALPERFIANPLDLMALDRNSFNKLTDRQEEGNSLFDEMQNIADSISDNVFRHWGDPNGRSVLTQISSDYGLPLICLTEQNVLSGRAPSWGSVDVFQQSFARLFVSYRDMRLENDVAQFRRSKGQSDARPVEDSVFEERFGLPPWDFVNQSLHDAGLDFCINAPDQNSFTPYNPQLTKISSGVLIPFNALSSGEKILMSLAFCVYYSKDKRQISTYPKIILFDEIDAPLHPSMSKNLVSTIIETLVKSYAINVIAATHSPSTVALSPEEAIFLMKKDQPGLHKASLSQALNILTAGVPTLAISYDGRRQVFVESPSDAMIYDRLYSLIRARIGSERSLQFIATGTRNKAGAEENTGCDVVKRLVQSLVESGNMSVFGLIDWDGHQVSSDRIFVLAHGRRNGLENVLLDPLLIAGLICRDCQVHRKDIGVSDDVGFFKFSAMKEDELQPIVNIITEIVIGSPPVDFEISEYEGGLKLKVDVRYFKMDDHDLEKELLDKLPSLKSISRNTPGKLMYRIADVLLADNIDLMPLEIRAVLANLLEKEAHLERNPSIGMS